MIKYIWLKAKDYFLITWIFLLHLKNRWSITNFKIFAMIDIFLLSIIIPTIIIVISNDYSFFLFSTSFLYACILNCCLVGLFITRSGLSLSKVLYEIQTVARLYWFMFSCYHNSVKEHKRFLIINNLLNKKDTNYNYDVIVMSKVFRTIFSLYFKRMEEKEKISDPYLIDINEMRSLYKNQDFDEFYTKIFFNPTKNNKPYEYLLIYILDHVLEDLYKKSWFVYYYDEAILFNFINFMLKEWYEQIILFNISKIKVANPVLT